MDLEVSLSEDGFAWGTLGKDFEIMYDDNLTNTSIKTDGYLYSIDDMNTWTSTPMTDSPSHFAARYSWLVNKDVPVTPYGWNDVDEDYYPDAALTQTCSDRNTLLGYNECSETMGRSTSITSTLTL